MARRLITGGVTLFILLGLCAALVSAFRPVVNKARVALTDSVAELEGIDQRVEALGAPSSVLAPMGIISKTAVQTLDIPEDVVANLTLIMAQQGNASTQMLLKTSDGDLVDTTVSSSNRIMLIPVARGWEIAGAGDGGCSSTFRITKATPWASSDEFYVSIEFLDSQGHPTASSTIHMAAESTMEWTVDMKELSALSTPWCGSAVITVHDDILQSSDRSERYEVQIEPLGFCDCPGAASGG